MRSHSLNRAGHAYIVAAVVTSLLAIALILMFITGLWRAPLVSWPAVLLAYLRGTLAEKPNIFYIGVGVTAALAGGVFLFAKSRAQGLKQCAGGPAESVKAVTGVGLFFRDVTAGVVIAIVEVIFG
jgi:hypothetical protein